MTRVKTSFCILGMLVVLCTASGIWLNGRCSELIALADEIRSCTETENGDAAAVEAAEKFQQSWQSFRIKANVIVKSDKLSEINRVAARIIPLLESGSEEISAELDELSEMLIVLQRGEKPLITSIL